MATEKDSQPDRSGTLNVLLHGAFTFVDPKEGPLIAWIPRIDHHVYRAGSWLAETDLRPGKYELKGVEVTGKDTFNASQNLILPRGGDPDPNLIHATLLLPRPDRITSLRTARVPLDAFHNPDGLKLNDRGEHIATLQIFSYQFQNDAALRLEAVDGEGHYWEPVFTGDCINLHIFSGEDHHDKPSRAADDFRISMALLGQRLELKHAQPAGEIAADEGLPPGVLAQETEDLAPRTLRMARLGRLARQSGDLNQAWYRNDALDGDPPACGSDIGI